ncbi:AfsR/SARP family transcriptional regulator [Streptomyces apocyni]|uniref:AfsR/SARP family transcriptional regulator n=1 Tax=Streptomyces apocyni TaxID=2654677 RepID=UPI002279513A|nr:BTAD domain-containing putative transcriptional regulator [Streptomyces apocyni]
MVFRILGPLDISADSRPIPLQGARQRAIMALLLLSPDRVVSVDTLADGVWNGTPPATARNQIAICVSALRKTFKRTVGVDDLLVTSHPGYLLASGEHRIDAVEFEERVAQGREAARRGRLDEACAAFEEALGMWRGPALEGVTAERVEREAARLTELRLDAYEEFTGLRLELGHHQDLVGELSTFIREHPLREQSIGHLMLAYYRSGRRAEALETYRDGHRTLSDELGISPGPALQELHDAILNDLPKLNPPPPRESLPPPSGGPAQLPPDVGSFTGRKQALTVLDRLLDHVGGNVLPVGSITGVGGVGKTALAVHWARQVAGRFPDGQFFVDMRGYAEQEPRQASAVLDRLLRSLGIQGPQIPVDQHERTALFRSVLEGRQVLIVLDNARSFRQIRPLLPDHGRCCVLVTSRDPMGGALAGDYAYVPLALGTFEQDEATALLSRILGDDRISADPVGVTRLSELCDRLPLALRIAAARLAAKPHWSVRTLTARLEDQHRRLDELSMDDHGVRAGLRLSYRDLPHAAARMFRLLGMVDAPDFAAWAGAALLDIDPVDAEDLIEQLVDVQLLEPLSTSLGPVRYRFQNLLRLFARECALAEESAEERRVAARRAYGAWLSLASEAHRRIYGGDYTLIHGPAPLHPLPDHLVEHLLDDPMEWFESERPAITALVEQAARDGEAAYAWDLTMTSVTLFQNRNYLEDWRHCGEQALRAAIRGQDELGEAAMLHSLGTLEIIQWEHDAALARLGPALELFERLDQAEGRALVLRNLAFCEGHRGDPEQARQYGHRALEDFRIAGDRYAEAHLLVLLAQIELERGEPEEAVRLASEAVARNRRLGSDRGLAQSTVRLADALVHLGDGAGAETACRDALELVRASADRRGEAHTLRVLGEALWCRGELAEAEAVLREGLLTASKVPDQFLEGRVSLVLGSLAALRADWAGAAGLFTDAGRLFAELGTTRWAERTQCLLAVLERAQAGARDAGTGMGEDGGAGESDLSARTFALLRG